MPTKYTEGLSRLQNLNSLRVSNIDVAFATAFGTLLSGAFLVGYMKTLGASDLWINLLAALPSLVGVLQIPGGIVGKGVRSYKKFVAPGGFLWRVFYIPLILLPLAAVAPAAKLSLLTACVLVASVATVFVGPVYNDWIAALVPDNSRGFYFARRNAIAAAVGALVGIFGAIMLDEFRGWKLEMQGFTFVFVLASVCGWISWYFFNKMSDLARPNPVRQTLSEGLRAIKRPFADAQYRGVLIFLAFSTLGQTFAGNLFVAYARESLALDYKVIQGTAVCMAIGNVIAASAWGFLSDKYGNKPLLFIASIALCVNPIPWMVLQPNRQGMDAAIILTAHIYMGVIWAGLNLCQFNVMLTTANPEDRANYIGAGATVTALVGGVAPLLGAAVMELLRADMPAISAYRWVFAATAVLRLLASAFAFPIREKGSSAVKTTLRDLSGLSIGGVRALRTLTRSTDMAARESAIEQVGNVRVSLAADEIIKALHDPLPQVRRRAAQALSRLDDPRAVTELVHQLEDHPDLLEEETVNALGIVGNLAAVPALVKVLDSPRPLLRRAAARSLGNIGARLDPSQRASFETATARLVAVASDPTDPDFRRAALQALRYIGSDEASEVVVGALLDPRPSVRIAAAEAIQEMEIASAAGNLRLSLDQFHDEACAEVAYALGVVGTREDIPLILHEAARSVSMITRRRCLLGIARLMGVEPQAYRLMLTTGMARDSALQEILRPHFRKNRKLQEAFGVYGSGDEPAALRILSENQSEPAYKAFAKQPVEELFLVASLAVMSDS
ncbi:MAG TPA: MFS transporter [Fimbriimonas sp.]|nr:MFS transporter [Fimbriimonas sp.]